MKKLILSTLICLAASLSINAQILPTFQLGAKAGMNFTKLKSDGKVFSSDTKAGYQAGLWGRVGIAGIHIQPEAYFTGKNTSIKSEGSSQSLDFKAIDVPILLGTKIGFGPLGARIQAGPLFSFMLDKPEATEGITFKDNATAIVGGLGTDITKLSIDLRYEHGLGNFSKGSEKQKLNLWTISLGYRFL